MGNRRMAINEDWFAQLASNDNYEPDHDIHLLIINSYMSKLHITTTAKCLNDNNKRHKLATTPFGPNFSTDIDFNSNEISPTEA